MERRKQDNSPVNIFNKFAKWFALLMTLLYVGLGLFLLLADEKKLNIAVPHTVKIILGGILILYGIVRFIRVYQNDSKRKRRYED